MVKITDEELKEIEAKDRHDDLVNALKAIPDAKVSDRHDELVSVLKAISERPTPKIDKVLSDLVGHIADIEKKHTEDIAEIIKSISDGLTELKSMADSKPKSFSIERNEIGLIERIVPEY